MVTSGSPLNVRVAAVLGWDRFEYRKPSPGNVGGISESGALPQHTPEGTWHGLDPEDEYHPLHPEHRHVCVWAEDGDPCSCTPRDLPRVAPYDASWAWIGPEIFRLGISIALDQTLPGTWGAWVGDFAPLSARNVNPVVAVCLLILEMAAAGRTVARG